MRLFLAAVILPPMLFALDGLLYLAITSGEDAAIWRLIIYVHFWVTVLVWPLAVLVFGILAWRGRRARPP